MRQVKTKQIVKNKYSIQNDEVVELENGEYYNKQIASQALIYKRQNNIESIKQLKELDNSQRMNAVNKACINKYIELKSEKAGEFSFNKKPIKQYEIYKLSSDTDKLMLINTKYFPDTENKEVYYDKNIAIEIYDDMCQLDENVVNSFPELIELYQDDIVEKQNRIEELKKEDEIKFQEALNIYNLLNESEILKNMKENYNLIENENKEVKEQLKKANQYIKELSKKLQITLNKIEKLQNRKIGNLEKIFDIFNKQKCLPDEKANKK